MAVPGILNRVLIATLLMTSMPVAAQVDAAGAGMSADRLKRATKVLDDYIASGHNAGSVALVYRKGHIALLETRGFRDLATKAPMRRDTIFNLASMTKPVTVVAAMILVEDGTLSLDAPIDALIPELANRQVLIDPAGPLTQVRPSPRPITLRDLLTHRMGLGWPPAGGIPADAPISKAYDLADTGKVVGTALMAELGKLPLVYAPGEKFMYNTSMSVLGVLVERASKMSLDQFFKTRIFKPLGMRDSGFELSAEQARRKATIYARKNDQGPLVTPSDFYAYDGSGGLYSTADDYLKFARMLLGKGSVDGVRLLSRKSVELMTHDQFGASMAKSFFYKPGFFDHSGYGFGVQVQRDQVDLGPSPGSFWWAGATGVNWVADPQEDLIYLRMVQRLDSFEPINADFITAVYQAIAD